MTFLLNCLNCESLNSTTVPLPSSGVQCFQVYDSGSCSSPLELSTSPFDCCSQENANAYQTSQGECVQCSGLFICYQHIKFTMTQLQPAPLPLREDGLTHRIITFLHVDGVEIAVERQVYSVIEGNEVEVCIVLISGAPMSDIKS